MDNIEVDTFTYNEKEYVIVKEIGNIVYTTCMDDTKDVIVFKSIIENDEEFFERLNKEETEKAMKLFLENK